MIVGNKHPLWLSAEEIQKIHSSLVKAETGTKGEIIPIVAEQAQPWRHVSAQIWMFTLALGLALLWQFQERLDEVVAWSPLIWIGLWSLVSFGLTFVLRGLPVVVRLFVSGVERAEAAHVRAELEFSRRHFDRSSQHATIVIFVAVLERQVVLLVEPELKDKIPAEVLQKWLDETTQALAQGFRQKDHAQALLVAIEKCGQLLREYVPGPADYRHEFPAEIISLK